MNLALEDRGWFEAELGNIDPRLRPSIRALAFREGIGTIRWEPLFRKTVERVVEYLGERLAELPSEKRRLASRGGADASVALRMALEFVFRGRGGSDGEDYVSQCHVAMALAAIGYVVDSDGRGLDAPEASCSFKSDFPCAAVVRQMRINGGSSIRRPQMDGLAPLARETERLINERRPG